MPIKYCFRRARAFVFLKISITSSSLVTAPLLRSLIAEAITLFLRQLELLRFRHQLPLLLLYVTVHHDFHLFDEQRAAVLFLVEETTELGERPDGAQPVGERELFALLQTIRGGRPVRSFGRAQL